MTLKTATKLFEHYTQLIDGTIPKPTGHKSWSSVKVNAEKNLKNIISKRPSLMPKAEVKKETSKKSK